MIGIDQKPTPVTDYLESLGYVAEDRNGKKIFNRFDSVEGEVHSLFNGVGLREASNSAIIEMRGKDALDFLHRISTNSLKELPKEGVGHTIFTSEKGRIIDIVSVINFSDHQLLICSDYHKEKVMRWIEKYVIMDDVMIGDMNGRFVLFELLGPQAESFITLICGSIANEIKPNSIKAMRSEGIIFFVARIADHTGLPKFYILADTVNSVELIKYMLQNKGPYDFNLIGEEAYNVYRIVNGIPAAPNELNDQFNPHEAKITNLVSTTKGCYIGQEVIARLDTYDKVQKYMAGVVFEEPVENGKVLTLFDGNNLETGVVTSAAYFPKCKKYVGIAYVRKANAQEGTTLIGKNGDGKTNSVVVKNFPIKK